MTWSDFRLHTRLQISPQVSEQVYALIAEIDAIKKSWYLTGKLQPQTIQRLTHSVLVTSTGASNRIEGNRLTDTEIEALYQKLRIKQLKTRDEQEIAGYLECLQLVFEHYQAIPLTESTIFKLHHDMLAHSERDHHHKGQYKSGSNRVEAKDHSGHIVGVIFDPTPPYLVQKEMQELLAWYHWAIKTEAKHPLILIANFIFEYLAIHPFQDGNGRTSRLLTNLMLLQQGYLFTTITSHERIIEQQKVDYYLALNKTQHSWKSEQEDITPWLMFFLAVVKQQSEQALQLLEDENVEYLLSAKQLELWQWASKQLEFSRKDAVAALGFPPRTVEAIIKRLTELKLLTKLGQGKATRYQPIKR